MDLKTAIYRYCNYQDRCHYEVRNKLYELGGKTKEIEQLIAELIEADLLNEERFTRSYVRGKFRMKRWGKVKILQQLKLLKISDYCIKKGMKEIDLTEYFAAACYLAEKKWATLSAEQNEYARKQKLTRYLLQKGYEHNLIQEIINDNLMNSG